MFLILIAVGWLYVALMMAVVEATSPIGSVLGALITFVFYGVGPVALLMYILSTPLRKRLRRLRENTAPAEPSTPYAPTAPDGAASAQADAGGHTPADAVATVRKEP